MLVAVLVAFLAFAWVAFWPFFSCIERQGSRLAPTLGYYDYKGYPVVFWKGYYKDYLTYYYLIYTRKLGTPNYLFSVSREEMHWNHQ